MIYRDRPCDIRFVHPGRQPEPRDTPMIRIHKIFAFAALALALSAAAAAHAQPSVQAGVAYWNGSHNEQFINQAVRHYGFRPNRLTRDQIDAIQQAWYELLGTGSAR